jgi:hypothetical protein
MGAEEGGEAPDTDMAEGLVEGDEGGGEDVDPEELGEGLEEAGEEADPEAAMEELEGAVGDMGEAANMSVDDVAADVDDVAADLGGGDGGEASGMFQGVADGLKGLLANMQEFNKRRGTYQKVFLSTQQVLTSISGNFAFKNPPIFNSIMGAFSIVNLDIFGYMSLSCSSPSRFGYTSTLLSKTLGLAAIVVVFSNIAKVIMNTSKHSGLRQLAVDLDLASFFILFLMYPGVCSTIFQAYSWMLLDDGSEWLKADLSINRDSAEGIFIQLYATIWVGGFAFGTPFYYFYLLRIKYGGVFERMRDEELAELSKGNLEARLSKLYERKEKEVKSGRPSVSRPKTMSVMAEERVKKQSMRLLPKAESSEKASTTRDGDEEAPEGNVKSPPPSPPSPPTEAKKGVSFEDDAAEGEIEIDSGLVAMASAANKEKMESIRLLKSQYSLGLDELDLSQHREEDITDLPKPVLKLIDGYEIRCYWFEAIETFRKLFLVGIPVLVQPEGSPAQLFFGLLVCFLFFGLQMALAPYDEWQVDVFSRVSQAQIFITLLCALVQMAPSSGGDVQVALDFILVGSVAVPPMILTAIEGPWTPIIKVLRKIGPKLMKIPCVAKLVEFIQGKIEEKMEEMKEKQAEKAAEKKKQKYEEMKTVEVEP